MSTFMRFQVSIILTMSNICLLKKSVSSVTSDQSDLYKMTGPQEGFLFPGSSIAIRTCLFVVVKSPQHQCSIRFPEMGSTWIDMVGATILGLGCFRVDRTSVPNRAVFLLKLKLHQFSYVYEVIANEYKA